MSIGVSIVFIEKFAPSQKEIDFALSYNKCTILAAIPIVLEETRFYYGPTT